MQKVRRNRLVGEHFPVHRVINKRLFESILVPANSPCVSRAVFIRLIVAPAAFDPVVDVRKFAAREKYPVGTVCDNRAMGLSI